MCLGLGIATRLACEGSHRAKLQQEKKIQREVALLSTFQESLVEVQLLYDGGFCELRGDVYLLQMIIMQSSLLCSFLKNLPQISRCHRDYGNRVIRNLLYLQ